MTPQIWSSFVTLRIPLHCFVSQTLYMNLLVLVVRLTILVKQRGPFMRDLSNMVGRIIVALLKAH